MTDSEDSGNPFTKDEYQPFAKDYLKELITNIRDSDQRTRRSVLLVITFATLYFIAHKNPRSSVTIFSLRIDDLSPLLAVTPIVTAYLFHSIVSTSLDAALTGKTAHNVLKATYPELAEDKWFYPLMPGDSPLTGAQGLYEKHLLAYGRALLVLLGPVILTSVQIYLYGDRVGWATVSFISCAAASLVMLVVGMWTFIATTATRD